MVYNTNTMISICSLKKKNVLCGQNKRFFLHHYRYYYLVIKKFFGVKTSSHKDCRGSSSINTQGSKGREAIYAVTKRGSRLPRQPENFPHKAFRSRYARTYASRPYTVCFLSTADFTVKSDTHFTVQQRHTILSITSFLL